MTEHCLAERLPQQQGRGLHDDSHILRHTQADG
jgi:hypothetical protein